MKRFDSGVSWYSKGKATINISFPEGDTCCKWCPYCRSESDLGRFWCRLTNEMLFGVEYTLGNKCPIEFEKTKEE